MAKILEDLTWGAARGQMASTVGVSATLTEVTGFRQDGILSRAEPGDVIVQMHGRFYVYPAATAAAMFTA